MSGSVTVQLKSNKTNLLYIIEEQTKLADKSERTDELLEGFERGRRMFRLGLVISTSNDAYWRNLITLATL